MVISQCYYLMIRTSSGEPWRNVWTWGENKLSIIKGKCYSPCTAACSFFRFWFQKSKISLIKQIDYISNSDWWDFLLLGVMLIVGSLGWPSPLSHYQSEACTIIFPGILYVMQSDKQLCLGHMGLICM